jgi:hypothetical protein
VCQGNFDHNMVSYDNYLKAYFEQAGFFSDAEALSSHSHARISRVP